MNSLGLAVFLVAIVAASASWGGHGWAGHGWAGHGAGAVVAGPAGAIVASAHPGVVGHGAVLAGHGALLGGHGAVLLGGHGLGVPAGHGLEGQWIPDINEHLYDDGSYKPHIYGH